MALSRMFPPQNSQHTQNFTEKPKRSARTQRRQRGQSYRNTIRAFFIASMLIPTAVFFMRVESGFVADSIAITIMVTAGVYLLYQGVVYAIATYLQGGNVAYSNDVQVADMPDDAPLG
ncbi:MAG: hypothetical protein AAFQ07_05235, partial [Chloroflexota bacterium]